MGWMGRVAVRFRYPILAWIVVTIFCVQAFPALGSIVNNDNSSFLPSSAPSKQAASLATPSRALELVAIGPGTARYCRGRAG